MSAIRTAVRSSRCHAALFPPLHPVRALLRSGRARAFALVRPILKGVESGHLRIILIGAANSSLRGFVVAVIPPLAQWTLSIRAACARLVVMEGDATQPLSFALFDRRFLLFSRNLLSHSAGSFFW